MSSRIRTLQDALVKLQETEGRFRAMADHAPVLLWMTGADAQCTFFNQGWMRFTGRTLQEEVGVGWAEGVHPEDIQRCMHTFMEAFAARRDFGMEYRLRNAQGEFRWVYDQGTPRFGSDGSFQGFIGSCVDVTEIREAREKLRHLNLELEQRVSERTRALERAVEELEAFSCSVSHDLRSPLRLINGYGHLLLDKCGHMLEDADRRMLEHIVGSSQDMGALVDGLLQLSRVGRTKLCLESVDISALVRHICEEIQLREPGRTVSIHIQNGLVALADSALLRVALGNLLANAWKFTGKTAAARIRVGARQRDGKMLFYVRDNGAGFDLSLADKLFTPFQRLHGEDDFPGSGIGLATVRRIVEHHGGRIWARGRVGYGATFYFTLGAGPPV